jgi:hypothetical protein
MRAAAGAAEFVQRFYRRGAKDAKGKGRVFKNLRIVFIS